MVSPIGLWLRRELRPWTGDLVRPLRRRQLDLPFEKPEDNEYDRRLHALILLELWLRTFIDNGGSEGSEACRNMRNTTN